MILQLTKFREPSEKIFMGCNPLSTLAQLKKTDDDVKETTLIILKTDQWWRRQRDNQ